MWWKTEELIGTAVIKRVFVYTPGSHQLQGDSRDSGGPNRKTESWWVTWNNGAVFAVHLKDVFAEHISELVSSNKNPFPPWNTKMCLNFKHFCELHGKLLFSAKHSIAQVNPINPLFPWQTIQREDRTYFFVSSQTVSPFILKRDGKTDKCNLLKEIFVNLFFSKATGRLALEVGG